MLRVTPEQAAQLGLIEQSVKPKTRRPSKRNAGQEAFALQCRMHRLPAPEQQWRLLKSVQKPRGDGKAIPNAWRFDFCWPQFKLIVEIDGGIWKPGGGAHSHPVDLKRNMEKRNDAALHGFVVLAFAPEQITAKTRLAISFTMRTLAARGWQP